MYYFIPLFKLISIAENLNFTCFYYSHCAQATADGKINRRPPVGEVPRNDHQGGYEELHVSRR